MYPLIKLGRIFGSEKKKKKRKKNTRTHANKKKNKTKDQRQKKRLIHCDERKMRKTKEM